MLIAGNIGSVDLRVHAAFGEADFWTLAELGTATARCIISIDSQWWISTNWVDFTTLDDVWISSIPCYVIGSVEQEW